MAWNGTLGIFQSRRRHRVRSRPMLMALLSATTAGAVVAIGVADAAPVGIYFAGLLAQAAVSYRWGWRWAMLVVVPAAAAFWLALSVPEVSDLSIALGLVGVAGLSAADIAISELGYLVKALHQVNLFDPVTKLANYDFFAATLHQELARSGRYRTPFALVLIETSELNTLAQQRGYRQVDVALREIARVMDAALRDSDVLARISGLSFGVLLPMTPRDGAMIALERLQTALRSWQPLTAVLGHPMEWHAAVVEYPTDGQTVDELLARAEAVLNEMRPPAQGIQNYEQLAIYARELQQLYRMLKSERLRLPANAAVPSLKAPSEPPTSDERAAGSGVDATQHLR